MNPARQTLDVNVIRAGKIADVHNFFCEIPGDDHRRLIISISLDAMPDRRTRALVSLIQADDNVAFDISVEVPDEDGFRRVRTLHSVVNSRCQPDPADYGG
jgi:hypothetical protein